MVTGIKCSFLFAFIYINFISENSKVNTLNHKIYYVEILRRKQSGKEGEISNCYNKAYLSF